MYDVMLLDLEKKQQYIIVCCIVRLPSDLVLCPYYNSYLIFSYSHIERIVFRRNHKTQRNTGYLLF